MLTHWLANVTESQRIFEARVQADFLFLKQKLSQHVLAVLHTVLPKIEKGLKRRLASELKGFNFLKK